MNQQVSKSKSIRWLCAFTLLTGVVAAGDDRVPFTFPSTGNANSAGQDTNYTIISNTIKEQPRIGAAVIVTASPTQAPGWPTVPGAKWIASDPDQGNTRNGCCLGIVRYQTQFTLKDASGKALDKDTALLNMWFAADDGLTIYLNPTDPLNPDLAHKVFSQGVFNAPANLKLTKGFQAGTNTMVFEVNNNGFGPTGLAVYADARANIACVQADGTACPPALDVTPAFVTLNTVSGTSFNQSPAMFINVRNSGGGGAQLVSVQPAANPRCPANGGSFPYAWQALSTTLLDDPTVFLKAYGTDPGGKTVAPGIYQGNLRITSGSMSQDICLVSMIPAKSLPPTAINKTGLLFRAQVNQIPQSQNVTLFPGSPRVDYTVKVKTLPGDNFLSYTTNTTGSATGSLAVSVTPQTAAGVHYGLIQLTPVASSGIPTAVIGVVYTVTADSPAPDLSPAALLLVASQDSTTPVQGSFSIKPGSGVASYTATTDAAFLALPAGAVNASTPATVTVNPAKLRLGFNNATVQVQFPNGTSRTVAVTVVYLPRTAVAAPVATVQAEPNEKSHEASFAPRAATTNCNPSQLAVVGTSLPDNFSQPLGWPVPYQVRVVDNCANLLTTASVVLNFSNGEQSIVAQLDDPTTGVYTAMWYPAIAGDVTVTVRANSGTSVSSVLSGSSTIAGAVTPNKTPLIYRRATVSNLYPLAGAPLAGGTVASVYGSGLATVTQGASALPLPTSIQGTSVTVGGIDAPLYSVSDGQINFQLPSELASFASYPVVVTVNGAISNVETITISDASPGIAAFADGTLIAQHASYQLVDASNPAAPNEALIIYLVGMGATTPAVATGQQAPAAEPLARLPQLPKVTVDGKPADLIFAGLTPGGIGLYQIVFTVPSSITTSGDKTVLVTQNGTNSNSTMLKVQVP